VTEDGFILRMFRIPHGRAGANATTADAAAAKAAEAAGPAKAPPPQPPPRRPVALLQHALMDSSAGWALLGPRRALAFLLADAGFDVWLANSRGAAIDCCACFF
jgi:hypothetical protein